MARKSYITKSMTCDSAEFARLLAGWLATRPEVHHQRHQGRSCGCAGLAVQLVWHGLVHNRLGCRVGYLLVIAAHQLHQTGDSCGRGVAQHVHGLSHGFGSRWAPGGVGRRPALAPVGVAAWFALFRHVSNSPFPAMSLASPTSGRTWRP